MALFGRQAELEQLDRALQEPSPSLIALIGPGGQGKTAIVQHWLRQPRSCDALFFWSFYRGKDVDRCLREMLAYAEGLSSAPEVSASWCVERLLARFRQERWLIVLDGTEVVQHEDESRRGRFLHPDLEHLLEEIAFEPMPGVVVITSRFELPSLRYRPHARLVSLERMDRESACGLLASLGVTGDLDALARRAGYHAKAVELLGTRLASFAVALPEPPPSDDIETCVGAVTESFREVLSLEQLDILALALDFREPPAESLLLDWLRSAAVAHLLHDLRGRSYLPFSQRENGYLQSQIDFLVRLRLLERVGYDTKVIDAHPLVRRVFENTDRQSSAARAGFLHGRPDRRKPMNLDEARPVIEMFHARCDAGMWNEADAIFVALENPKHRLLAPALERDLLLRFFPEGDPRQQPLWPGFGRRRSLAIALEMLGEFEAALATYPERDAALRGDALLALGRFTEILAVEEMPAPWQPLWRAYRAHALAAVGRCEEAVSLTRMLFPADIYEWVHVYEALRLSRRLDLLDVRSIPEGEHRWGQLARRRIALGLRRDVEEGEYGEIMEEYDRAGLLIERMQIRRDYADWLEGQGRTAEAQAIRETLQRLRERMR
jgi:hypothetical protein